MVALGSVDSSRGFGRAIVDAVGKVWWELRVCVLRTLSSMSRHEYEVSLGGRHRHW